MGFTVNIHILDWILLRNPSKLSQLFDKYKPNYHCLMGNTVARLWCEDTIQTNLSIPLNGLLQLLMRTLHTDPKFSKHDTQVISIRCKFMFGMNTKIVITKNHINISRRSLQPYCIKIGKIWYTTSMFKGETGPVSLGREIASTDTFLPLRVISLTL